MQRKTASLAEHVPTATRIAWWVALLATLALAFTVGIANSAQAMTLPAGPSSLAAIVLPDDEEEAGEDDEGEEEAGFEECELSEDEEEEICEEVEAGDEATPPECLLNSATATVAAIPARDTVRISVRYTSRTSAAVNVELKLRGRKGSLKLGGDQERFKRSGVFRETQQLTDPQMAKVVAAKSFTVELLAVNTPRYCHRYFDSELTVKRASGGGLTWSAPAARSGV
jgi:hypothetical protein